ncbi:MAG TPA: selenocysteine-specific translation elongation factor [Actinomycetota bacterium]|nr:selenocysteine-specific translation elongation factor [Actinomycetota bacterium]
MHVIGTAGHVDHGKSTLVERLTGIDPDRFAEEKRRGLTIDLGFAWLQLPSGNEIGIIDVPGHERFIRNMLAGAGGTTVCLFVVAANEGWKPQSAEHLAILHVLGVSAGVVALTKSDSVDKEALAQVRADVESRIGASSMRGAPVVACSAITGDGLDELIAALDRVVQDAESAPNLGRPRLWVDRVFTIAGAGTVVTGTLAGGSFEKGEEVEISPEGRRARVRGIQSHKKEQEKLGPGNRAALNLAGLDRQGAERGDAIVSAGRWRPTNRLHASIRVLDPTIAGRDHELTEKGAHLMYVGAAETPVRIRLIGTDRIGPGAGGYAELRLRDALPLARGDRFVLRDAGRVLTFGGGLVLDPLPTLERRDPMLLPLLEKLTNADAVGALMALLATERAIEQDTLRMRTGVHSLPTEIPVLGDLVVAPDELTRLSDSLVDTLDEHHRSDPLAGGLPKATARNLVWPGDPGAFDALVSSIDGVVEEGSNLRLASHKVRFDEVQDSQRSSLLERLEASAFNPPLADDLGADRKILDALTGTGELVRIGNYFLTAGRAAEARRLVRAHIEANGPMTVAQIRDLLATSRKYAVPLAEWLDATGATIRKGDNRLLGPRA